MNTKPYAKHADEVNAAIAILIMQGDSFTSWEGTVALKEANNSTSLSWLEMMGYVVGAGGRYSARGYKGIRHGTVEQTLKVSLLGLRYLSL